ncbi:ParB/RepB/Spo0J family partition protein [Streptomyces sp. NBC_01207]|nr:ParB/RepB/Spo0J family partition protein [Streptomyces sp. NBC_01207]
MPGRHPAHQVSTPANKRCAAWPTSGQRHGRGLGQAGSHRGRRAGDRRGTVPARRVATAAPRSNPENPRESLGDLEGLVESMKEVGQVTAITVATVDAHLGGRPDRQAELEPGARYVVVDAHRRLTAAREAGFSTLKVTVNDAFAATDETLLEAAFVAHA